MTSRVSICNQALDEIGKDSISSFSEDSAQAFKCRAHYDSVRKSMLSAYPWKFARTSVALAGVVPAPYYEGRWIFGYVIPSDCLKVRRLIPVVWLPDDELGAPFSINGNYLYTYDFTTESLFPPLFTDAFAMALASRLCMPLTNNLQGKIGIAQLAARMFTAATVWDANLERETSDHTSEMITARL
jgi:hypothetical protein